MSVGLRRSSLLSVSLFDMPSFHGMSEPPHNDFEADPFAPLSIYEGGGMSASNQNQHRHESHVAMNDRSESSGVSVPSLSASSYSSNGSIMAHSAAMSKFASMSPSAYETLSPFSPRTRTKPSVQLPPKVMSSLTAPHPVVTKELTTSSSPASTAAPAGSATAEDEEELNQHRFKPFHEEKWTLRYKELLEFHKEHGHSAVPHTYPKNPQLARWVKRQRRQYKLRRDNRASTMTSERLEMLSSVGFVWDSHDVNWREKLDALQTFRKEHGHCNVPSNYVDKKLATWVKCQRRQYKLYWDGKPSAMSPERILELEKVGFEWEIRSTVPRKTPSDHPPHPQHTAPNDFSLLYHDL